MGKAPVKQAPTQEQRFIEAAREVGAIEDEDSFMQRPRAVAGANSTTGKDGEKQYPREKRG